MTDQLRHNAGKLKLSYWLGTQAYLVQPSDDGMYIDRGAAQCLEFDLASFVRGETRSGDLVAALKGMLGDDMVGEYFTRSCMFGEQKYCRGGFMLGAPISQYCDSAARHLKALRTSGAEYTETYTKDGVEHTAVLNHWEGVCWNIVMIFEVMTSAPQRDDRLFHLGGFTGYTGDKQYPAPTVPAYPLRYGVDW